jgi:cell filamentation protein
MPYDVDDDPYQDEETGVLRNLLGIRNQDELDDAEARLTAVEIALLTVEGGLYHEDIDLDAFTSVHHQLFKEIYPWAGQFRIVELTKGLTSFARFQHIETNLRRLLEELRTDEGIATINNNLFIRRLAYYYAELIVLHPYREGNGRAIRTFLALIAEGQGWHIAWDAMDPEENIAASIAAYNGELESLRQMLDAIVTPQDIFWGRDPYEFIDYYE